MPVDHATAQKICHQTNLAVSVLEDRGCIRVSGKDRERFLQGLVSNDMTRVYHEVSVQKRSVYACFLTPQGKFLHDMIVFADEDSFYLDVEGGDRAEDLLKRLAIYKLRSDIKLENLGNKIVTLVVFGRGADRFNPPDDVIAAVDSRHACLGWRILCPIDQLDTVLQHCKQQGGDVLPAERYRDYRISLGIPSGSEDMIVERSTLMEGGIDQINGISWNKGCYMGQELTARMKYRNLGKRQLVLFKISKPQTPLKYGMPIYANDKTIGDTRSSSTDYVFGNIHISDLLTAIRSDASVYADGMEILPVWLPVVADERG